MIEQAIALQSRVGLSNLEWHIGDVAALPRCLERQELVIEAGELAHRAYRTPTGPC